MNQSAQNFAPLPTIEDGFACLACDAPLRFRTWSAKGQGTSPSRHYRDYSVAEIMTLPVRAVAARDAWLFLWCRKEVSCLRKRARVR